MWLNLLGLKRKNDFLLPLTNRFVAGNYPAERQMFCRSEQSCPGYSGCNLHNETVGRVYLMHNLKNIMPYGNRKLQIF